jgi:hypothetical protein
MKVIISLQEFYDAVGVVAAEHGQTYFVARVEHSTYEGIKLDAYINGFTWQKGKTIAEVCQGLRAQKHLIEKTISSVTDVEVETDQPDKPMNQQIDEGLAELKKIAGEIPEVSELKPL